jgi:transposase
MDRLKTIPVQHGSGQEVLKLLIAEAEAIRKIHPPVNRKTGTLSQTEFYAGNHELTSSVPGTGPITGMSFLTAIEDINRFSSTGNFAGYAGPVPSCRSSGEKESNGAITSRAPKMLRDMIMESAWTATRKDPALHPAFCQLCKRMEPNKAIIRIARKLLNRIYHVLKNKVQYVCGTVE